jgi:hypothetical protein
VRERTVGDPASFVDFVTNLSLGVPVLILGGAALTWWITTRVFPPPVLTPTSELRSWRERPGSMAYAALTQEHYLLATFLLRERVLNHRSEQADIVTPESTGQQGSLASAGMPSTELPSHALADLREAYRAAYLAEELRRGSLFAGWTAARRRRHAEQAFELATEESARILDPSGAG